MNLFMPGFEFTMNWGKKSLPHVIYNDIFCMLTFLPYLSINKKTIKAHNYRMIYVSQANKETLDLILKPNSIFFLFHFRNVLQKDVIY